MNFTFKILYTVSIHISTLLGFCLSKKRAASSLGMYVSLFTCITSIELSIEIVHGRVVNILPENMSFTSFVFRKKESRLRKKIG